MLYEYRKLTLVPLFARRYCVPPAAAAAEVVEETLMPPPLFPDLLLLLLVIRDYEGITVGFFKGVTALLALAV